MRCGVAGAGLAFAAALSAPTALAQALPTGEQVRAGQAHVSRDGLHLNVRQPTPTAIISWETFSIGQPNSVHVDNGSGATLNRVRGNVASQIDGSLTATGSLYLINPAGVAVGPTGRVRTGGSFVGSTLDLANEEFEKAARGEAYTLKGDSAATVRNAGRIGSLGGDVALVGRHVENTGDIDAPGGTAALVAGREVLVQDRALDGGRFVVKAGGSNTSVKNSGNIKAAEVELRANGGNVYALAGNRSGVISATGTAKRGGRVFLTAGDAGTVQVAQRVTARGQERANGRRDGGAIRVSAKNVRISATLDASGRAPSVLPPARPSALDGDGGLVIVTGESLTLTDTARVDVSGAKAGTALIGGDFQGGKNAANNYVIEKVATAQTLSVAEGATIAADGAGDAGRIVLWSDARTDFDGHVSATSETGRGGDAEVSGKAVLSFTGSANLLGPGGAGTLLLDPYDIVIHDGADDRVTGGTPFTGSGDGSATSYLNVATLVAALSLADVKVTTGADPAIGGTGNITVSDAITWGSANTLTLEAYNDIYVNASVTATDAAAKLRLRADSTGTGTGAVTFLDNTVKIDLPGAADLERVKIYHNGEPDVNVAGVGPNRIFADNAEADTVIQTYQLVHDAEDLAAINRVIRAVDHDPGNGVIVQIPSPGHYALSRDIDLGNAPWTPIRGTGVDGFSGLLDGLGHTIRNINVSAADGNEQGLFTRISGYVRNLTLDNVTIHAPNSDHVGALAGRGNWASLANIHALNVTVTGRNGTGGLVGFSENNFGNTHLSASGTVQGAENVGGLFGQSSVVISTAHASGTVKGVSNVGGLVGYLSGNVEDVYATTTVYASSANAGGLVGVSAGNITRAYATGLVTGGSNLGGLVGNRTGGSIANSFWDADSTGMGATGVGSGAAGGAPVYSSSAGNSAYASTSYTGFTFGANDPWYMVDGETRPMLRMKLDQAGKTWDSAGSLTNTYTIRTAEQLQLIRSHTDAATSTGNSYLLANDIDFGNAFTNSSNVWRTTGNNRGFAPIGTNAVGGEFSGTFNGLGHVIRGLTIHRTGGNEVGLFGKIVDGAVQNLILDTVTVHAPTSDNVGALAGHIVSSSLTNTHALNVSIKGDEQTGGLVGNADDSASLQYLSASGTVEGNNHNAGGLIGLLHNSTVSYAYTNGSVEGAYNSGGIAGYAGENSRIYDVYSTSSVTVTTSSVHHVGGGLVGIINGGEIKRGYATGKVETTGITRAGGAIGGTLDVPTIADVFWDVDTTGQPASAAGGTAVYSSPESVTANPNKSAFATLTYSNFDFDADDPWYMVDGETRPMLRMTLDQAGKTWDSAGSLTNTYTIRTAEQLQLIRAHADADAAFGKTYILANDIDLAASLVNDGAIWRTATTQDADNLYGFVPIGTEAAGDDFAGAFDGRGHVISNLTIHRPQKDHVGLFGWSWGGTITNVGLEDVQVTGRDSTGGLGGYFGHSIAANVWTSGNVTGVNYVGGLVGNHSTTTRIENARSGVNVVGTEHVGGLVGILGPLGGDPGLSVLTSSYASGTVTGNINVGGLVGWSLGTISDAYATGPVTANAEYGGGLVGFLGTGGTIARTYATGLVTGGNHLGGLVGGRREDAGAVTASFWDLQRAGSRVGSAIGMDDNATMTRDVTALTSAQFRNTAYFVDVAGAKGWDFNTVWAPPSDNYLPELYALSKVIRVHSSGTVKTTYGNASGAWAGAGATTVYGGGQYAFGSRDYGTHAAFDYGSSPALSGLRLDAGTYGVAQVRGLNTYGSNGYRFVYTSALDVAKAALTVTVNNASKTYDGEAWSGANGVEYSGFASGETESVLSGALVWGGNAQGARDAGTYTITANGLTSNNYDISFVDGTLRVAKAALTITASDATKIYDAAAWTGGAGVVYNGFVGGDTASALGGTLTWSGSAQSAVNAGAYTIAAGGLTSNNYDITYADGTLTVAKAALTINPAEGQSKIIGDDNYRIAFDAAGWQGADGPALFDGALGHEGASAGDWAITLGSLSAGVNYSLTLAEGARLTLVPGFEPAPSPEPAPIPDEPGGGPNTARDKESFDRLITDLLNGGIAVPGVTVIRGGTTAQIARNLTALPLSVATRVAGVFLTTATVPTQRQRVTTPVALNSDTIQIGASGEEIEREIVTTVGADEHRPFRRWTCDTSGIGGLGGGSGGIGSRAFVPANLRNGTCG